MCAAITQRANDLPVRCEMENTALSELCFYHQKMMDGNIKPYFEDAFVKTSGGTTIYSKSLNRKNG
jgi:hypothetical protein